MVRKAETNPGRQHSSGSLREESFPPGPRATRPGCLVQQGDPEAWQLGDRVQQPDVFGGSCLIGPEGRGR